MVSAEQEEEEPGSYDRRMKKPPLSASPRRPVMEKRNQRGKGDCTPGLCATQTKSPGRTFLGFADLTFANGRATGTSAQLVFDHFKNPLDFADSCIYK